MVFKKTKHVLFKLTNMVVLTGKTPNLKAEHICFLWPPAQFLLLPMIEDDSLDGEMDLRGKGWRGLTDVKVGVRLN